MGSFLLGFVFVHTYIITEEMSLWLTILLHNYTDLIIIRQYIDRDYVISEIITEGTHLGEWLGIKPSGKKLVFTGVNIDRLINGKIVEHGGAANIFDTFWAEKIIQPYS
jgi:hypothetical protein